MGRLVFLRSCGQDNHSVPGVVNSRSPRNCVGTRMPGGGSALNLTG